MPLHVEIFHEHSFATSCLHSVRRRLKSSALAKSEAWGGFTLRAAALSWHLFPVRQLAECLIREIGVASIPLSAFYADGEDNQVLRFCFAKNEDTLSQAAERLCRL